MKQFKCDTNIEKKILPLIQWAEKKFLLQDESYGGQVALFVTDC